MEYLPIYLHQNDLKTNIKIKFYNIYAEYLNNFELLNYELENVGCPPSDTSGQTLADK